MKGRKTKKLMSLLLTAALAVMMMTSVVCAANQYTAIPGTSTTFDKYLILPADAAVPSATFNFTVEAGTAVSASDGKLEVFSGTDANRTNGVLPTIGTATFAATDIANTEVQTGDTITLASGQKYVAKEVTVDFAGVTYNEPGVYRYTISENIPADADKIPGMTYDNTPKTLDVYIEHDATNNVLTVGGYVLYNREIDTAPSKTTASVSDDKATGFTNSYATHNLTISKTVSGNQASRDEYFEFTVSITGAAPSSTIVVDLANAQAETTPNGINTTALTNPASFTTDASGAATYTCYIQHDQSVILKGLPDTAKYTVTENVTTLTDEGYVASIARTGEDTDPVIAAPQVTDTTSGITNDTALAYTNTKEGVIPTGIILSVAGLLVVGIIAVIGFVFFGIRSKKRYDED